MTSTPAPQGFGAAIAASKPQARPRQPRPKGAGATLRATGTAAISETEFQQRLIETAQLYGWKVVHYRKSRHQSGKWATAVQGDNGGQDIILAKNGLVILAELKKDRGSQTNEQKEWEAAAGAHARVWRPRDWDAIFAELSAGCTRGSSAAAQAGCDCPMCPAVGS